MSLHTLLVSTLPLAGLGILCSLGAAPRAQVTAPEQDRQANDKPAENERWQRPAEEEIKRRLTPLQYRVTQEAGTGPPFRNPYWDNKWDGIYVDVVSGEPLFSSRENFESGTGWPSFHTPLKPDLIVEREDHKLWMVRTEVRSRHGGSHLGHVFDDSPGPAGLRYCINSATLRFIPVANLEKEGYGDYLAPFRRRETEARIPKGACYLRHGLLLGGGSGFLCLKRRNRYPRRLHGRTDRQPRLPTGVERSHQPRRGGIGRV